MLPDRVSNLGPLTYESGALPIALRGPAIPVVTLDLLLNGNADFPDETNLIFKGAVLRYIKETRTFHLTTYIALRSWFFWFKLRTL